MIGLGRGVHPTLTPVNDHFVTLSVGNTLILKACGFIEAQRARILDVCEEHLLLRIGNDWLERLLLGSKGKKLIEVRLKLEQPGPGEPFPPGRDKLPRTRYCLVDVQIRPVSQSWTREQFQDEARRLLWILRSHFMAC